MPTTPDPLDALATLAGQVRDIHITETQESGRALDARRTAVAAVLAAALPALPAIACPYRLELVSGNDALRSVADEGEVLSDWTGIRIAGSGRNHDGRRDDTRGTVSGSSLIWRSSGDFATLTYSGTWSRWQGEADRWEADVEHHPALADAMTTWPELDPEAIAGRLALAMKKYLDAAPASLASLRADLDRAHAVMQRIGGASC
jgi:hypothetical protein